MGYTLQRVHRFDLYPLVCTIISGDVTRHNAIRDISNVVDFPEINAHLQGLPADICAQPQEEVIRSRAGGASKKLAMQLAETSLSNPEAVVPKPLIQWPVQVSC